MRNFNYSECSLRCEADSKININGENFFLKLFIGTVKCTSVRKYQKLTLIKLCAITPVISDFIFTRIVDVDERTCVKNGEKESVFPYTRIILHVR